MKHCNACLIDVDTPAACCPLCGTRLDASGTRLDAAGTHLDAAPDGTRALSLPTNPYPDLSGITAKYNFVLRLFVFLSLLGCGLSVLINLVVNPGFLWSLIVVAAVVYLWAAVPPLLRRGANIAKRTALTALLTSLLVVAFDLIIGYRGWSVSYVVPSLLMAGLGTIALMMIVSRTSWMQYVFYQLLLGVFGFIPLVLYFFGLATNLVMVLVCAGLALACLLLTIVFGDKTVKSDFKRRFNL